MRKESNQSNSCVSAQGNQLPTILYITTILIAPPIASAASDNDHAESLTDAFSVVDDRLIVSAEAATLSGAHGGGGGSGTWVEDLTKGVAALGADYETLGNSHWAYAELLAGFFSGTGSYYIEVDRGAGDSSLAEGNRHFIYRVTAGGAGSTIGDHASVELETRQIDVDSAHGNLPKATFGYEWRPELRTSVAYAHSVTGNLGTEIASLGVQAGRDVRDNDRVIWLVGGAFGRVSPPVVNVESTQPAGQYRQGYVGASNKLFGLRWSVTIDYLTVSGSKRAMLTVTCSLPPME